MLNLLQIEEEAFVPPFCPRPSCPRYRQQLADFCTPAGRHRNNAKDLWVRRFRCKYCGHTFSSQTFRVDYWDKKPLLNAPLFDRLTQSGGLRETHRRFLGQISRRCLVRKGRKVLGQTQYLHGNHLGRLPEDAEFSLDELVTFEGSRITGPLTLPVLIETKSMLVIAAESAPIAPAKRSASRRKARIEAAEARSGKRPHREVEAVRAVLETLKPLVEGRKRLVFHTDKKPLYGRLLREVFGAERVVHLVSSGRAGKQPLSPLFRINLTAAILRDLEPRLRRRSWLAAKDRRYLNQSLQGHLVYRNCRRRRFNQDPPEHTPAVLAGLLQAPLTLADCVQWRQDFGEVSIFPSCRDGKQSWKSVRAM